jgi:hypothetical protein
MQRVHFEKEARSHDNPWRSVFPRFSGELVCAKIAEYSLWSNEKSVQRTRRFEISFETATPEGPVYNLLDPDMGPAGSSA